MFTLHTVRVQCSVKMSHISAFTLLDQHFKGAVFGFVLMSGELFHSNMSGEELLLNTASIFNKSLMFFSMYKDFNNNSFL